MVSLGMLTARALSTAARRRGLPLMSPPPSRAEIVSSLMTLVQSFDFFESEASFLCLILDHRLWPDMVVIFYHNPVGSRRTGAGRRGQRRPIPGVGAIARGLDKPMHALAGPAARRHADPAAVAGHDRVAAHQAHQLATV